MERDSHASGPPQVATSAAELVGASAEQVSVDINWLEKKETRLRMQWQSIKDAVRVHGVPDALTRQIDSVVSESHRFVFELQEINLRALTLAAQCMIVTARSPAQRPIVYAPRGQQREPSAAAIRTDNPAMPVPGPLGLADDVFSIPACGAPAIAPFLYDDAEGDAVPADAAARATADADED
jgi:hypothetical protein